MAVSNGQIANQTTFNNAFPSKTVDDQVPSKWDLTNGDAESGENVVNLQKAVNEASSKNYTIQQISSGGTIDTDKVKGVQNRLVQSDGGDVTISSTPFGAAGGWKDGTEIRIVGGSNTNRIILEHSDVAFGVILNGNITLGLYNAVTLIWFEGLQRWIEIIPRNS